MYKKAVIVLLVVLLYGCGSDPIPNTPMDTIFSYPRSDYTLNFLELSNDGYLRVTFDVENTMSSNFAYSVTDVRIVDENANTFDLTGAGMNCSYSEKMKLKFARSLYPDTKSRYVLCFDEVDPEGNPTLYLNVLAKDTEYNIAGDTLGTLFGGDKSVNTIELGSYLGGEVTQAVSSPSNVFTINRIRMKGDDIELTVKNNDLIDYEIYYLLIEKNDGSGTYNIPLRIEKRIVQGRYVAIDTSKDLLTLSGEPYELKNINAGDEFRFSIYLKARGEKLTEKLCEGRFVVP